MPRVILPEPRVHPAAVVEPGASVDPTAVVGPYAVLGPRVVVGPGCRVEAHAVLQGATILGPGNCVGAHAVLGGLPQVRGLAPEAAGRLEVGRDNVFREHVTVHVASAPAEATRIGDGNLLMIGSHVAHDCTVGDGVELANGVQLAGHVTVEDHAALGGLAAVHQFVRVGRLSFVGAGAMVSQDVPPFSLASGDRARVYDANTVGLRRRRVPAERRQLIRRALRLILAAPTVSAGVEVVRREIDACEEVDLLVSFVLASQRGVCPLARRREP